MCRPEGFLRWLARLSPQEPIKAILASALAFVAWLVESGPVWDSASADAALHAPVPRGSERCRRLDPALPRALAAEAATGSLGRTGAQVNRALARLRCKGLTLLGKTTAHDVLAAQLGD